LPSPSQTPPARSRFPGVEPGAVVKIGATTERYEGTIQLKVDDHKRLRAATELDGVDQTDFMRRASRPAEEMRDELIALINENCAPWLSSVLCQILDDTTKAILESPAAMKLHHPYIGGLLEHTLSLCFAALWAGERYNLSDDVMVAIAVLHDIGKIIELDPMRGNEYTRRGRMFGHIAIGYEIARDAFDAALITEEEQPTVDAILHGILSHHGSQEKGSPVVPCTKEAIAFHHLDMIDSRMSMFDEALRSDKSPGEFTEYNRALGGALLKGKQ
jgi:3'-5' exoribonuclease